MNLKEQSQALEKVGDAAIAWLAATESRLYGVRRNAEEELRYAATKLRDAGWCIDKVKDDGHAEVTSCAASGRAGE